MISVFLREKLNLGCSAFRMTYMVGTVLVAGELSAADVEVHAIYDQSYCVNNGDWAWMSKYWGDGQSDDHPNADTDYVLDHGKYLRLASTASGYQTFPGKSLRIGTVGGTSQMIIQSTSDYPTQQFSVGGEGDGLVLANGSMQRWAGNKSSCGFAGKITVTSPATAPFALVTAKPETYWYFTGKLVGDANACLVLKLDSEANIENRTAQALHLLGDSSDYFGTIEMKNVKENSTIWLNGDVPGSLILPSRGILAFETVTTDSRTVGNLTLVEGSEIIYDFKNKVFNHLVVSGDLVKPANGKVALRINNADFWPGSNSITETWTYPLISVAADSGLTKNDFEIVGDWSFDRLEAAGIHVTWTDDDQGRPTLSLSRHRLIKMTANDTSGDSFGGVGVWEFGEPPTNPNVDNLSEKYWYSMNAAGDGAAGQMTWAGGLLILRGQLVLRVRDLTVPSLTLDGANLTVWHATSLAQDARPYARDGTRFLRGDWVYVAANATKNAKISLDGSSYAFVCEAPLKGPGSFDLVLSAASTKTKSAYFEFMGDNSAWTGKQKTMVSFASGYDRPADFAQSAFVRVGQDTSLGGPLASFSYDALTLQYGAVLWPHPNHLTLATPNRGILVSNVKAGIKVEDGDVFTVNERLTLGAGLHKLGAGRLVLGGDAMQFCTDENPEPVDVPSATYHKLTVDEGDLEIASIDAVNGAALSFAAGTRLVVRVPRDDDPADFKAYGFRNVKADNPIALAEGVERLAVAWDLEDEMAEQVSIPLITVKDSVANALINKFKCAKFGKLRMQVVLCPNDDDTTTLVAEGSKRGFVLLVH